MSERQFAVSLIVLCVVWLLLVWAARINAQAEARRKIRDAARFRRQFAAETNLHNWLASRDEHNLLVAGFDPFDWYDDRAEDFARWEGEAS
jgi:hypothetical protein